MELRHIFFNVAGRLRSGWRLLVFVLLLAALSFLITAGLRIAYALALRFTPNLRLGTYLQNLVFRTALLTMTLLAGYLCTRWLEGLPWRALGLSFHTYWLRDLLIGSVIGAASLALAAGIATAGGGLRFSASGRDLLLQVGQTLLLSAALFIVAALAEEALFRGYPLQTMSRAGL